MDAYGFWMLMGYSTIGIYVQDVIDFSGHRIWKDGYRNFVARHFYSLADA